MLKPSKYINRTVLKNESDSASFIKNRQTKPLIELLALVQIEAHLPFIGRSSSP